MHIDESCVWIRQLDNEKESELLNGSNINKLDETSELITFDTKEKNTKSIWNFIQEFRVVRWIRHRFRVNDNAKKADLISS